MILLNYYQIVYSKDWQDRFHSRIIKGLCNGLLEEAINVSGVCNHILCDLIHQLST